MKFALAAALLAALLSVSWASCVHVPVHKCVKDAKEKKCTAVKVCEDGFVEPCGSKFCKFPFACVTSKKKECKDFLSLKKKCDVKKVCKAVKKPCGDGFCSGAEDCVKEVVCTKTIVPLGRRLAGDASASASAVAVNGQASASATAISVSHEKPFVKPCPFCKGKEILSCKNVFTCIPKDPCKKVVVKKCVKEFLTPGIDFSVDGFPFTWAPIGFGEKCGLDICHPGFKCADVIIKKCSEPCGATQCPFGFECVTAITDAVCDTFPFLETICKDVFEPVCALLSPYAQSIYDPPCKTVFKCDDAVSVCGNSFCPAGHKCVVTFVKKCDKPIVVPIIKKPDPIVVKKVPLPVKVSKSSASAVADKDVVDVDTKAVSINGGDADAKSVGASEAGLGTSHSSASKGSSSVTTTATSDGGLVIATGDAESFDK